MAETALVGLAGPKEAAALGPQLTAPPPFDLFHDLRWISVYHNSWPLLGLELVAAVVFRSVYIAWILQSSWPNGNRPRMPAAALRASVFYVAASLLLVPWVALLFGMALTHLSYLFFVSLPPALAIIVAIHRGALAQAAGRWWRWRPTWTSMAWILGAFLWLTIAGAIITVAPLPVGVLAAGGAGFLNARAVVWITAAIGRRAEDPPLRHQWMVPVTLITTFAIVVGGTALGFAADAPDRSPDQRTVAIPTSAVGHPVLVVAGFNSEWDSAPKLRLPHGYVAYRYSYRGMNAVRELVPYRPADTLQPILVSARRMAHQVEALHAAYHEPVTIVSESEGALVARSYLIRLYRPSSGIVRRLIVLDMPIGPRSVFYPPPGAQGWGVGTGWTLRGLAAIIRRITPLQLSADAPLFRDIAECGALMRQVVLAPAPDGVEQITVQALADAVDAASSTSLPAGHRYIVVSAHGGLIHKASVQSLIFDALEGTSNAVPTGSLGLVRLISAMAEPWNAPSLARGLSRPRSC
jgi:hypothetical protein